MAGRIEEGFERSIGVCLDEYRNMGGEALVDNKSSSLCTGWISQSSPMQKDAFL